MENKLSVRQAETVARMLREKQGRITASALRWKTPREAAIRYLGGRATESQIRALVTEIMDAIGKGGNNAAS